ncbi:hypothetical protein BDV96DRAFT_518639 [Lophiotrema nucula]|uniref:NmrA-like domain-containing protein n=1 Tax=Lophiotrema nucula TaxID=690887 RepID=A0A6A5ZBH6_9PLEO|nr:hypothetical protein BDV96DRAFT_518639 [Lophiotrema nucula]
MIALTSATGKLGSAVLNAILENNLIDTKELVVCTSSDPSASKFDHLRNKNITLRYNNFDDPSSLEGAFQGCDRLFLVSTPKIALDYNDAPLWSGREKHHRNAIDAAVKVGVKHIYYTSLAFGRPSKAGVMRAHIRTEEYLEQLQKEGKVDYTVIREGLYNESWPLYLGYYFGLKEETRKEIVVAGDGPISWTSIPDMGFCTAKILAGSPDEWKSRTVYLSQSQTWTAKEIAEMISKAKGEEVQLKVVGRKEFEDYYAKEKGMERPALEWWSSSYDAVKDGECKIEDSTLEDMLKEAGRKPKSLEVTVQEMMK